MRFTATGRVRRTEGKPRRDRGEPRRADQRRRAARPVGVFSRDPADAGATDRPLEDQPVGGLGDPRQREGAAGVRRRHQADQFVDAAPAAADGGDRGAEARRRGAGPRDRHGGATGHAHAAPGPQRQPDGGRHRGERGGRTDARPGHQPVPRPRAGAAVGQRRAAPRCGDRRRDALAAAGAAEALRRVADLDRRRARRPAGDRAVEGGPTGDPVGLRTAAANGHRAGQPLQQGADDAAAELLHHGRVRPRRAAVGLRDREGAARGHAQPRGGSRSAAGAGGAARAGREADERTEPGRDSAADERAAGGRGRQPHGAGHRVRGHHGRDRRLGQLHGRGAARPRGPHQQHRRAGEQRVHAGARHRHPPADRFGSAVAGDQGHRRQGAADGGADQRRVQGRGRIGQGGARVARRRGARAARGVQPDQRHERDPRADPGDRETDQAARRVARRRSARSSS